MNCPASGTMRANAAQPRQVRKEATVSGGSPRRGLPDAGVLHKSSEPFSNFKNDNHNERD